MATIILIFSLVDWLCILVSHLVSKNVFIEYVNLNFICKLNAKNCIHFSHWMPVFVFELFIGCLNLHFRKCSFFHIPSLLHEETVDQHCSRERFSSWSYLPLSPGQEKLKPYGLNWDTFNVESSEDLFCCKVIWFP